MDIPKRFLHDRLVLLLLAFISCLMVIGVSLVLIRFDATRNPTTTIAYRPNITGSQYQSGKPLDIYALARYIGNFGHQNLLFKAFLIDLYFGLGRLSSFGGHYCV
jgi:hypothetical protein